jgi:hypothetical protein
MAIGGLVGRSPFGDGRSGAHHAWALRAAAALIVVAAPLVAIGQSAPAGAAIPSGWNIVTAPSTVNPALGNDFVLGSACANAFECWAVGFSVSGGTGSSSTTAALIEQWNGSAWSLAPSPIAPSPGGYALFGVTCVTSSDCWAVGGARSVTAGTSPFGTLTENWNGTSWSIVPSPTPAGTAGAFLRSVDCVDASDCWAVGNTATPTGTGQGVLTEQWNGSTWSVGASAPATATYSQLNGVSCASASDCWAVGTAGATVETSTVPNLPGGPGDQGLIEQWNGATWSVVPSYRPATADGSYLSGVTCLSSLDCWATGAITNGKGKPAGALMEKWNGSSWSVVPSPTPLDATRGLLEGVSCLDATRCWAVGTAGATGGSKGTGTGKGTGTTGSSTGTGSGTGTTGRGTGTGTHLQPTGFIDSWNGSSWSVQPSPNVSVISILYSVTCLRGTACWAVGSTATNAGGTNPGLVPIIEQMVLPPAANQGMLLAARDGGVFAFGNAAFAGSMGGKPLNQPIVGIAATPDGNGYWEVAADGGIFAFGDATFYGSMGGKALNKPIVGIAATPDGQGYWEVASDGGIFAFGNAIFYGSMGGKPLNQPIVGIAATPDGNGYWEVASDGGIFAFGDATFYGSMGGKALNKPIVGIAATPNGNGYLLSASDGGIFSFGNASYFGSVPGQNIAVPFPVVGVTYTPDGGGYWEAGADGSMYAYGDAVFLGSLGGIHLAAPVSGIATE